MALIDLNAIKNIALVATVPGTGGNGYPTQGKLITRQVVSQYGPVQSLSLDKVLDDSDHSNSHD